MVNRPSDCNAFEFVVVAALRTQQLMRGCIPRVPSGHKPTTTAQLEIVAGKTLTLPSEYMEPIRLTRAEEALIRLGRS